jgi:NAD(P)-dependent dehydrogenase (short-subunit alcohol dehydrogenase family)
VAPYLEGRVAIVTGVSSGLGWGVAKAFAKLGADVVGLARRADRGAALAKEIETDGGRFTFVPCDVADPDQCQRAVDGVLAADGQIDILINNAGTSGTSPVLRIEQMTESDWDSVLQVNLRGAFTMTRLVLPSMQSRQHGVIINIASMNAVIGVAGMAAYNASKAGLVHLTNTTAVENLGSGVRAIGVIMGGVESEMADHVADEMGRSLRGQDWRRIGERRPRPDAEAYGRALALFCSDDAALITGATIALDGGASAGALASKLIYLGASESI